MESSELWIENWFLATNELMTQKALLDESFCLMKGLFSNKSPEMSRWQSKIDHVDNVQKELLWTDY